MSAKMQPTEPSKGCNEPSFQIGRATTPVSESGAATSSSTNPQKGRSRSGRPLKPSAKQQARIDANKANKSRVSRIKGNESINDKAARCDFTSKKSINKEFPCHKGKGTLDIPSGLLSRRTTPVAKAKAVQEWRMLTQNQQQQRVASILASKQREEESAARTLEEIEKSCDGKGVRSGKRKRKPSQKQKQTEEEEADPTQPKRKKRAPNKDKTQEQLDESAKKKREREDRRNKKRRDEAAKARESRLQQDNIAGSLVRPDDAAGASKSAKALTSSKNARRKVDTQPATVHQLTDKTARGQEESAFKTVVQFAERNKLTSGAVAEAGADAKNTQVVVSINTVAEHQIGRLGGQAKNSAWNADDLPEIKIGVAGGKSEWEANLKHLFDVGALECLRELFEQNPQPVQPSANLTFLSSVDETDKYYESVKDSRKRAPKVQTSEQVRTNLGTAVTTQTKPLRSRN